MKIFRLGLLLLSFIIMTSSCSRRMLDFTLVSSKNVDLSKGASFVRGKNRVKGVDKIHLIVFVPTGSADIKDALDKAIESTPGCVALLDGVIYSKFWWIPYIYGQQSATVEGLPLIDPSLADNTNETIPLTYGKLTLNKQGEIKNLEHLSQDEYYVLKNKIVKQ